MTYTLNTLKKRMLDNMRNVILKNWSLCGLPSMYAAPEATKFCLQGEVFGHPHFDNGEKIFTSEIVVAVKKLVRTKNNVYILGHPDVTYMLWCEEKGIKIDEENPIDMWKIV